MQQGDPYSIASSAVKQRNSATLPKLAHLHFRLLQPGLHTHLAVHRGSLREKLASLFAVARLTVELAES
jgi:hypothetical protein